MNLTERSYPYSYNTNYQLESSGYESASNDSSLIVQVRNESIVETSWSAIKDHQIDIEEELTDCNGHDRCHQKHRVLSRSQREEANRRERHRMKILNQAYERLRNVLPFKKGRKRQKMSRTDTVIGAIKHIRLLLAQLDGMN